MSKKSNEEGEGMSKAKPALNADDVTRLDGRKPYGELKPQEREAVCTDLAIGFAQGLRQCLDNGCDTFAFETDADAARRGLDMFLVMLRPREEVMKLISAVEVLRAAAQQEQPK